MEEKMVDAVAEAEAERRAKEERRIEAAKKIVIQLRMMVTDEDEATAEYYVVAKSQEAGVDWVAIVNAILAMVPYIMKILGAAGVLK